MHLELTQWRRTVNELYSDVRAADDPAAAHALWRAGRDELFRTHPQSPLEPGDPFLETGLPYWPYDPALRIESALLPSPGPQELRIETSDGTIRMSRIGRVDLPAALGATVDVWSLDQYGGGVFLPLRDGTAGSGSYGAGRYLLDTAKGADLGGTHSTLTLDLNFLYHPSCRYSPRWSCPLAADGNRIAARVEAGERYAFE
ncbi:MAG: hypothetical protein JWN61_2480 [Pseudonocardiales bacterium]|nr:hypothetical protein [Pseudonocardiales bacterium]